MAEYTLYCFAQSGNAYKAALMLNLCGADWEPRFVDFFKGETRTPEFRQINEMGEVPVLEHEGVRLSQSGVILDYLARTTRALVHEGISFRPGPRGRYIFRSLQAAVEGLRGLVYQPPRRNLGRVLG
jgi:glutathione S-transferase